MLASLTLRLIRSFHRFSLTFLPALFIDGRAIRFTMNPKISRSRNCLEQVHKLPEVRHAHVNRGRYLLNTGIYNDEQTLRRVAELLVGLMPQNQERERISTF